MRQSKNPQSAPAPPVGRNDAARLDPRKALRAKGLVSCRFSAVRSRATTAIIAGRFPLPALVRCNTIR
jgi:hypothetical protein